jgi:hypothetical protein
MVKNGNMGKISFSSGILAFPFYDFEDLSNAAN